MISYERIYNHKLSIISWFMLIYFGLIFCRLFYLQIIEYQKFANCGKNNFLRFKTIPAQRGNILDCNGNVLATNQPVTQLTWKGSGNAQLTQAQEETIDKLNLILGPDVILKPQIKRAEKFCTEILIAPTITPQQLCIIAEQCSDTLNLIFTTHFQRFYPYATMASHILGYLGGNLYANAAGKMGLEKIFEDNLRGQPTVFQQSINSFGSLLDCQEIIAGSAGEDLKTSIDLDLQQLVEECMKDQIEGSCLILDPHTGLIKAVVSKPNFDPTFFSNPITSEQWQELQQQKIFLNRAFNASYPPASVFKLVTIAAALEQHIISQDSHFLCTGYTTFKDRKYYCNKHTGHGLISTEECLAYSCNIPLCEIAKQLPIDTLARYACEFGFGNKTNIPFSEQHGLVPTNKWKLAHKGERWWTGETLSACIGQSFLLVTPIQIACMIGSIFTGYLVKPRIILDTPIEKKAIKVQAQTRLFLQACMKSATSIGSARRLHKIGNLTIFSKTGTVQTKTRPTDQDPEEIELLREYKNHAWCVNYFYTDNTQPLVLVMMLEHVGKSTYATSIACSFFINYLKLIHGIHATDNQKVHDLLPALTE